MPGGWVWNDILGAMAIFVNYENSKTIFLGPGAPWDPWGSWETWAHGPRTWAPMGLGLGPSVQVGDLNQNTPWKEWVPHMKTNPSWPISNPITVKEVTTNSIICPSPVVPITNRAEQIQYLATISCWASRDVIALYGTSGRPQRSEMV